MVLSHRTGFPNRRFFKPEERLKFLLAPGSRHSSSGEGIALLQTVLPAKTRAARFKSPLRLRAGADRNCVPAGARPAAGTCSAFSTLAGFGKLMQSAVASGNIDSFWEAVTATGQMPLIFGDDTAVFLYRGRAENMECQGDVTAQYVRQGGTDLWAFIGQFEPDARVEYKIRLKARRSILDPLNPFHWIPNPRDRRRLLTLQPSVVE